MTLRSLIKTPKALREHGIFFALSDGSVVKDNLLPQIWQVLNFEGHLFGDLYLVNGEIVTDKTILAEVGEAINNASGVL